MTDIWNVGTLNSHLRNLAQSEVQQRLRQQFVVMFRNQTDSFLDVLRVTKGVVFGASLLELFYLVSGDSGQPPTIVIPVSRSEERRVGKECW